MRQGLVMITELPSNVCFSVSEEMCGKVLLNKVNSVSLLPGTANASDVNYSAGLTTVRTKPSVITK